MHPAIASLVIIYNNDRPQKNVKNKIKMINKKILSAAVKIQQYVKLSCLKIFYDFNKSWRERNSAPLIITLLLLFSFLIKSTGDTSKTDWISAISDITMALVAILAYFKANNYIQSLSLKDGYEIAKSIVSNIIPSIEQTFNNNDLHYLSRKIKSNITSLNNEQMELIESYIHSYSEQIQTASSHIIAMNSYGLFFCSEQQKRLDNIITTTNTIIRQLMFILNTNKVYHGYIIPEDEKEMLLSFSNETYKLSFTVSESLIDFKKETSSLYEMVEIKKR
ncbi:TPA: hypothetical protein L9A94_003180 [Klebsiella pneumoniae]|nr:hypothetical protein [Klebsiella pneumoniae]